MWKNNFWQNVADDCAYLVGQYRGVKMAVKIKSFLKEHTPGVKNFVKIARSHTISEINAILLFTQKFKMATKNGGKKCHDCIYPTDQKFCPNLSVSDLRDIKDFS